MNWKEHITADPSVLYGKPIIKNTRIAVDLILEKLAKGASHTYLLEAYPRLTQKDISACLMLAAESVNHEIIFESV